jgi:hypothetical protein
VASSTWSMVRHGPRGLINSVLYRPLIVSASALSAADRPDRGLDAGPVLPKGTDLKPFSADYLTAVAVELNGRPRKTLGWATPAEALAELLSQPDANTGVIATTP